MLTGVVDMPRRSRTSRKARVFQTPALLVLILGLWACGNLDGSVPGAHAYHNHPSSSSNNNNDSYTLKTRKHATTSAANHPQPFDIHDWQSGLLRKKTLSIGHSVLDFQRTCFSAYWDSLPSSSDSDSRSPPRTGTTITVNGHSFRGRMALYKDIILDGCDHEWNDDHSFFPLYHFLWAYGAQLDWQHRSGRLNDNNNTNSSCIQTLQDPDPEDLISTNSWWGYMNFAFSVALWLGYRQATEIVEPQNTTIVLDSDSQRLLELPEIQEIVQAWKDLFQNQQLLSGYNVQSPSKDDELQDLFELQQHVWNTHIYVIEKATSTNHSQHLLNLMPSTEQLFARGWATMVDILAAACFPTDLVTLCVDGAGYLPLQVVDDTYLTLLHKQSDTQVEDKRRLTSIRACQQLATTPKSTVAWMVKFWKRVVRGRPHASREMPEIVFRLFHGHIGRKVTALCQVFGWWVRGASRLDKK